MMRNLSPSNSSTYSGHSVSTISSANGQNRNRPQPSDYIKTHKNISFSFAENLYSFQLGNLGDSDSYLVGTVHLNYPRVCSVKSVYLHFKGTEKTCWYKSQARSKISYSGEHTLVDQSNKIWEAYEESEGIISLDIPFKIQLPINLQETITTEIGNAQYVLRVIVNTKGLLSTGTHIAKLHCPLRRTIILNQSLLSPYKICGESPSGIEYTFILPPNKYFNMGSYVSIPMMIRFLRSGIGIDRLEIGLKTLMDFSCSNQNEKTHIEQRISGLLIPNSELRYVQSNNPRYHLGEYVHTINIFVPRDLQPTYQGRLINITHQLCIKFCLFGFDKDFQVEEYIKIARIVENIEGPPLMHDSQISQIYNHNNKSISSLQIQHQQNVLLTSSIPHESFDQFRDYHRLVAPFDDRLDQSFDNNSSGSSSSNSSNNNNNNSTMQQSHLSYQSSQYSSSQHSLSHHTLNSYRSNNTLNSLNSQVSSNASSNYNNNNNKYRSLMHNKNSSNSEISSLHSLPTPLPVKEINTNYSSMITKSPYPTPLSPPPYRQPLIRQTSLNNNISAYNKYKKYTQ